MPISGVPDSISHYQRKIPMSTFPKDLFYQDNKNPALSKREQGPQKKPFRYRILVVDDEKPMRRLIADLLSKYGHQCMTANNGIEALDQFNRNTFNAVITDIGMPEMDGIALTREAFQVYPLICP